MMTQIQLYEFLKVEFYFILLGLLAFFCFQTLKKWQIQGRFKNLNIKLFFFCSTISIWFGGKALYLIVKFLQETELDLAAFWFSGGFVFYGGLGGFLLNVSIFKKYNLISQNEINSLLPLFLISHSLGRIGCWISGCCFGSFFNLLPIQLVESIYIFTLFLFFKEKMKNHKNLWNKYLLLYSIGRWIFEIFRDDDQERGIWVIQSLSQSTSQLISLILIFGVLIHFMIEKRYLFRKIYDEFRETKQ